MSREDHLRNLITNHNRRLQKLEEQRALCGLSIDPRIPIEIENIEAEIKKLQAELEELEHKAELPIPKQRVQIYLQGDFSSLTADRRSSIVDALSGLLRILPEAIEMYRVHGDKEWITKEGEPN